MPNWCMNHAVLTGTKEDVANLVNALQKNVRVDNNVESFWWPPQIRGARVC
jgi:hypothetical protein